MSEVQLAAAPPEPEVDIQTYKEQRLAEEKAAQAQEPEVAEEEEAPAEDPDKVKAWKEDDEEEELDDTPEHKVPVKKVIELRKKNQEAKAQLEQVRAQAAQESQELAKYREREAALRHAALDQELERYSVRALESEKFNSWEEYQAKVLEYQQKRDYLLQEKSVAEWERRNQAALAQREQQRAVEQHQEKLHTVISDFNGRVETAVKANPEIGEAVQYFRKTATSLPDAVLGAIMDEEAAPQLVYEILTNKKHIDVVYGGDAVKAVKLVARLAAQMAEAPKVEVDEDAIPAPLPRRTPEVPKTVTGRTAGLKRDPDYDNDDMATFLKKRRAEESRRR